MDELHDAIQDAQYIGAVTNAHRGPSAAFYNPSQSELAQFVEKQERSLGSDWLGLENILDQPLGFYFLRRFCDAEQHGVRKLDFLTEVTKFRALVALDQRVMKAKEIWDQFCAVAPQFGSSSAGPIGLPPAESPDSHRVSGSPVSTVTSSPAPTLSSQSPGLPSDTEGVESGRQGSSRFTLGSLKDLNVASITTNGIIFWRKGESTCKVSEIGNTYKECASESSPIGVGGEVVARIGLVIKRKAPVGKTASGGAGTPLGGVDAEAEFSNHQSHSTSPGTSQSTSGRSGDRGNAQTPSSDVIKSCPPSLFDELEACVLYSLEQMHLKDFRVSVFHKRLVSFLYLQTKRVNEEDFTVLRVLGRGGFGMVNGCIKRTSASLYAMKVMNKKMIKKKHAEKLCLAERKILAMISSPFVVCLKYAFQTPDELFLVLDLRTGGDLSFHLNRSRFTENQVRYWAAQILLGLQHLHEKNIVYRDLKPENILLDEKGNCSISDLGLAVEVTPTLAGRCGTRGYWAPEMLLRDENGQRMVYNHAVDWWSYGCLVYELLYGKCPFRTSKAKALHEDKQQAYDKATLELTPSYDPKYFSPEAAELIQQLLIRDPAKRLGANGAAEVRRMKFFDPVDWVKMENMMITPPFVPDNEINAASQADIGSFDISIVKGVKISEQDQAAYSNWDFVCPETFQREAIEYLEWEDMDGANAARNGANAKANLVVLFGGDGEGSVSDGADTSVADTRSNLLSHCLAKLSETAKEELDDELTAAEFVDAIKSMSLYKAPGHDSIPAKVYQLDPQLFASILLCVFNDQCRRGLLLPDQRRSIICLLHKKGDRKDPVNYRPIWLIPVDMKIFARVLTNRFRPVMDHITHRDQSGFVKGRHIQHPLVTMFDLQELVTSLDIEAYAMMVDFEKAYDRVDWEYLWRMLQHFNFSPKLIKWAKLLYTRTEVCLTINGHVLDPIFPSRGVKQGDPLSPLLFILALEPLCCAIRAQPQVGLALPGLPPTTGMYFADDPALLSGTLEHAEQQIDVVKLYCKCSVLQPEETVRYLGLPFGQRVFHEDRLSAVNAKFYSQFSVWKWRAKTLQGRKILAQALMASQLWYCSAVTYIPETVVADWQRMLKNYVIRATAESSTAPLLLAKEWLYHAPGTPTLRLPNVECFIRRQRLNLLQQLAASNHLVHRCFGWLSISLAQLADIQPGPGPRVPLGALWMPTPHKWFDRHPSSLSPWWVEVLTTWATQTKKLNLETLPAADRQRVYLTAPIWNNRYPQWQYQSNPNAAQRRPLWRSGNTLVRSQLAASGFTSLQDFLTPRLQWSTLETFATTVYLVIELPNAQARNIAFLYHQLSQVFYRVLPSGVDTSLIPESYSRLTPLWPWHVTTHLKCDWFPAVSSKVIYLSLCSGKEPRRLHPFQHHVPEQSPANTELQRHAQHLRRFVSPRTLDVTLRIWWRILPVHYFFWRQHDDSRRYCVHGCAAIETYRHLFWEHPYSNRLLWL